MSEIITADTNAAKMAAALGLDQPSGLDIVGGQVFKDDDALLDAATKAELERSSPEYQAVRRRLAGELQERRQREQQRQYAADYDAALKKTTISEYDKKQIDAEARRLAQADFADMKITSAEMGATAEKYAAELTEAKKRELATNAAFNGLLRTAWRG